MDVFPAFIPLAGARVVVVGEGEAAEAKARLLAGSPAQLVRVANAGAFDSASYAGARLVFIAVEDEAVRHRAAGLARSAGALVNVVDRPELSDFATPAIVDRSPVLAAVGTGGAAPVLATLLRNDIEARWPEGLSALARLSGDLQRTVRERLPDLAARRAYWRRVLNGPAAAAAQRGALEEARDLALAEINRVSGGRVWVLAAPDRAEQLSLAAVRAFAAADRIVADGAIAPEVLAFARRDARREQIADPHAVAAWAGDGEAVLVVGVDAMEAWLAEAAELGVAVERLPTAG